MNSQEISYNQAPKSMRSRKENSQPPQKSIKIPLGNLIRKMCSTKNKVAWGSGEKRRQSSFTVNVKKEGGIILIKLTLHAQPSTLAHTHTPFSRTHSRMHAFASPPRHQPQSSTILKQQCLGQGPKGMKSFGNLTTAKKHEISYGNLKRLRREKKAVEPWSE